jgi:hypothetical protein
LVRLALFIITLILCDILKMVCFLLKEKILINYYFNDYLPKLLKMDKKELQMKIKFLKSSLTGSLLAATCLVNVANAGLIFTDTSNITLSASQVESGGDTTVNQDVTGGLGGMLLAYTATATNGTCCGGSYSLSNLNDGDIGTGITSDGRYALPYNGDLRLAFGADSILGGIAIYNGYGNRDNGTYTLLDDMGATLGAWKVNATVGGTNDGVDSFWLSFNTPVTSSYLTLRATNIENNTASYREIQVFSSSVAVSEPSTLAIFALGVMGLVSRRFKKQA